MTSPSKSEFTGGATTVIQPESVALGPSWAELYRHRELLYFLTWRDIKVRYKQTILGVTWAILQPLAIAITLSAFLAKVVNTSASELPYPVFAYSGMVIWQFFSQSLSESGNSLLLNERLISKVYFPRILVPLSSVLASLLDFTFSLFILAAVLAYFRIAPHASLVVFPFMVMLAGVIALGAGLWLSALNVKYRDIRYTISFLVQFWFFATPIAYPASVVPTRWRTLYELNPMVGAVEGFRWAFRGTGSFPLLPVTLSAGVGALILMSGLYYFRHTEGTFADFI